MMNGMKNLIRILVLCLCMVLLSGAACADNVNELCKGENETLYYDCTLSDGRLLLSGRKWFDENDGTAQAWLVCLNADRTMSWEYISPIRDDCQYIQSVLLKDGRIALTYSRYYNDEDTIAVFFFTQDGQLTGKELAVPAEGRMTWTHQATPSFLMLEREADVEDRDYVESEIEVMDWDGNKVDRFNTYEAGGGYYHVIEEDDGLVLYGQDPEKRAKILKKDGMPGNVIWETTVEFVFPDTTRSHMLNALECDDGGYIAWIREYVDEPYTERIVIAKFDARGKLQWLNKEYAEKGEQYYVMTLYNNRVVMRYTPQIEWYPAMNKPMTFRWLDTDGKELGTTELTLNPDNYPALQQALADDGNGMILVPSIEMMQLISMPDGLWGLVNIFIQEGDDPDAEWLSYVSGNYTMMVKIPEL